MFRKAKNYPTAPLHANEGSFTNDAYVFYGWNIEKVGPFIKALAKLIKGSTELQEKIDEYKKEDWEDFDGTSMGYCQTYGFRDGAFSEAMADVLAPAKLQFHVNYSDGDNVDIDGSITSVSIFFEKIEAPTGPELMALIERHQPEVEGVRALLRKKFGVNVNEDPRIFLAEDTVYIGYY